MQVGKYYIVFSNIFSNTSSGQYSSVFLQAKSALLDETVGAVGDLVTSISGTKVTCFSCSNVLLDFSSEYGMPTVVVKEINAGSSS
eukprot:2464835-Ditylum_brightwellii.AAC.1